MNVFAYDDINDIYLILDIQRDRVDPEGVEKLLKDTADDDGEDVMVIIEQEPGSAGKNYIEMVKKHTLKDYAVKGIKPTGPKTVRANPVMAAIGNGRVKALDAPYLEALRKEISAFPDGEHDDQIDSLSQAYTFLKLLHRMNPTWGRDKKAGKIRRRKTLNTGATFGRSRHA